MTKGITGKEPDPRTVYADIIDLPHHQSTKHPHMSLYDRAAQFAPFMALSGFEDMVNEEMRYVDQKEKPGEQELDDLNRKLLLIDEDIKRGHTPAVSITYFVPDESKTGGKYTTVTEQIKKIDMVRRQLVLVKARDLSRVNEVIDMDMVSGISGELVNSVDEYGFIS